LDLEILAEKIYEIGDLCLVTDSFDCDIKEKPLLIEMGRG
jgi:hypothetical protein